MFSVPRSRRMFAAAALLATTIGATACDEGSTGTGPLSDIAVMRLAVGNQSVNVSASGVCTGCPLVVTNGAAITATFLNRQGVPDVIVSPGSRYRLRVTIPTNTVGLTFTLNPSNSFAGTFSATGTTATPIPVLFNLHDFSDGSNEYGPRAVNITVATTLPQ